MKATATDLLPAEQASTPETLQRPTPEEIDDLGRRYKAAEARVAAEEEALDPIKQEAIQMVMKFGIVPPHAEKSRKLTGKVAELTVTKGDTLTIKDDRVETLKEALEANGRGDFFPRLFAKRSKYEVVEGAEAALIEEPLPKRLAEKVLNLFGRCIGVKPKKPTLKVTITDPTKPAKKTRAKK